MRVRILPPKAVEGPVRVSERIAGTPEAVREALARLLCALSSLGLDPEDGMEAELVLAEAMNNIMEHAYAGRSDGWIALQVDLLPGKLRCRLEDGGAPMPNLEPPEGAPRDVDVPLADLPEDGFGWFLIRELTERLDYCRQEDCNRLSFELVRRRPDDT